MPSFCKRHLTIPAHILYYIDRQCVAFAADISTTGANFPTIFSERIVPANGQHFGATIRTGYLIRLPLDDLDAKYRRKGIYIFSLIYTEGGGLRKKKRARWREKYIHAREREKERKRALRNGPVLMDSWTWHKARLRLVCWAISYS